MATIDSKKLLPSSKESSAIEKPKFLVPIKSISVKKITGSDLKPVDKAGTDEPGSLVVVKKRIVSLSKLINNNLLLDQREASTKRKEEEKSKREKKEKDLEQKVKKNNIKPDFIGSIPGQSIFDKINRFIGFTLLGYLFNQYGELLPKLMEFGKVLEPVGKFVEGFAKNILKGVVDFVEFGYKAYDQTRDFVKQIGGEGAEKTFDEFSKNLNLLLNGAIGAAMLIVSTSSGKPGKSGAPGKMSGGKPSTLPKNAKLSGYLGRDPQTKLIERRYGNDAARMYEARKSQGASVSRARADVVKRFEKFEGPQRGLAGGTGKGSVLSRGLGKSANRASLKVLGKTGTRIARGAFGRVPIVGGLIDFAFSLAMGENPGRAAAKAVGATVGSALGTFIPVPFAGTILGGILGDIVGGAMYDTLVGSQQKPQAKAQGGTVRGSGQSTVAPSRKLKTKPKKTAPKIQSQKTQPGKDAGGKLRIEELYGTDEPGKRSALRALKKSSEDVKKMSSINGLTGAMFGAGIDMTLGQKPDKKLAKSIGDVFGSVVQNAVNAELNNSFGDISKTIAMANGGVVPTREIGSGLSIGERIGKFISNALAISIESSASRIIQNLNRELNLEGEPPGGGPGGGGGDDGGGASPSVSSDSADFWLLSLISLYENSNPQGASDVAQSIYNRMGYSGRTARQLILARNQYEPVGKFGSVSEWNKVVDKESALNHIKKYPGNSASASGLEKVAANLLDKSAQQNSAKWVGNRPDFRSESSEKSYDDMTDDISRYGQTFGFNRGSAYKGKSPVAQRIPSLVKGTVSEEGPSGVRGSVSGPITVVPGIRDQQGRPVMFAKPAAEAFAAMMQDAKEQGRPFRGSDIASTYRTPEQNKRAKGAAKSLHLKGLAADIHGSTGSWIRSNGRSYGWVPYDYAGTHGGHYEFIGGFKPTTKSKPPKIFQIESKNNPSKVFDWNKASLSPTQPPSTSVAFANDDMRKTDTSNTTYFIKEVAFVPIETPTPVV
jgi:hypothetical protein